MILRTYRRREEGGELGVSECLREGKKEKARRTHLISRQKPHSIASRWINVRGKLECDGKDGSEEELGSFSDVVCENEWASQRGSAKKQDRVEKTLEGKEDNNPEIKTHRVCRERDRSSR
jgi:hypothetical protein